MIKKINKIPAAVGQYEIEYRDLRKVIYLTDMTKFNEVNQRFLVQQLQLIKDTHIFVV